MIIFTIFSLFAGILVLLLPETRDQPLPDTLQDAVTFLKNTDKAYECVGGFINHRFLGGKFSVSAMGVDGGGGGKDSASCCCNCENCTAVGDGASCGCGTTIIGDERTLFKSIISFSIENIYFFAVYKLFLIKFLEK
jgi:hypothetical protein